MLALYEMRNGKVVNTYDVNPLSNHCIVTAIAFDHNEQLWFTVYDYRRKYALCTLDKSSGMVVDKCNDYGDAYALAVDNDNTLWVATKQGLLHYTDQSQTLFNSSNTSLTEDAVSDVKIDERNNIWFITDHNLCCYNRTTFTTYPIPYSDDFLRCFDIDGKDIYVGTHQHGMLSLTNNALTPITYTFPNAPTSSMRGGCVDKQGRFWAGTMTGAFAYNPTDGATEILPMRQIDEIVSDNKGDVWLKPFNTGDTCLIEITPTDTIAYRYDQYPFNDNYICQMRFDHTNRLWLATTHGLIFRDNGQWHVYSTTNSNLPTNYIYSIDFDSQNNVWCGTFGAGLTCFNGTSFTTYTTKQGLESDFVATVCVDKNDVVWFNCRSSQYPEIYGLGLSSLHNGQFKTYTANNSQLASNTIWDIETDAKNNLWLATGDDKGVTQFDGTHWNIYNTDNSGLALNEATHIALDEYNRRIWFTCYTGGGVTYANLQYDNSAVTTLNASKELTIRNNHVLLDLPANVSVFDTTGHLILSDYGTNIDLSNLHRGIYIVHTSNTNYRAARIIIP
ncbi:MAG: two-component regulator propeller domain-containing protein [Sodaliphilus sp.]|nr:two-component regulator propeller domain-containing protein [Sodaliphilus sp.]